MSASTGFNLRDLSALNGSAAFNRMAGFEVLQPSMARPNSICDGTTISPNMQAICMPE